MQAPLSEAETEISEEGAIELLRIEKALRGFQTRREEQRRACFCQGRSSPPQLAGVYLPSAGASV